MLQTLLNDRYQIIKELGYGGFGTTYLAKDTLTQNSWCAVKKLNSEQADLQTAQNLFKREADTLLQLQEIHQVPKFIDYFEENNCSYIVEEYIEGFPLDSLLSQQWNIENIIIFLWEILSILQLLHSKNIVHRDIKPSNLIQRKKDNKFTIIDFGAVKEIDPQQDRMVGTCIYHQGYAPPEQIRGIPQLNSDIHALGMTAIELITKEPPREIIRDDGDRAILPESKLAPTWLIDILNKMVKSDFVERYQSVEEVLKDLGQRNNRNKSTKTNPNLVDALQINNRDQIDKQPTYGKKISINKFICFPLIIASLLLISSEFVKPWIRPWHYLNQGNKLLDDNQPVDSLSKFQRAINLQRNSADAWQGRGDALFTLGRYSGALTAYKKAASITPENAKVLNNIGKILYKQGQFQQAISAHQKAINIDSENADAWSSRGLAQLSMQQFEPALKSFNNAQNIKPENPNIWIQKGIVLKALQRPQEANMFYQEALDVYDEMTSQDRNNPLLWVDKGFVLLQLNRPQDAFAAYDRALMLDENLYEALLGKANVLSIVGDSEQALATLDRAKEIRPKDYQVWYNRGNLLLQALNKPEAAAASFKQATQLKADFHPAWLGQGLALNTLQQYSDALLALDKAKDLNPQDPFVWMNRGIVLEALGELDLAVESYQTAAVELNFPPANERLIQLQQKMQY